MVGVSTTNFKNMRKLTNYSLILVLSLWPMRLLPVANIGLSIISDQATGATAHTLHRECDSFAHDGMNDPAARPRTYYGKIIARINKIVQRFLNVEYLEKRVLKSVYTFFHTSSHFNAWFFVNFITNQTIQFKKNVLLNHVKVYIRICRKTVIYFMVF